MYFITTWYAHVSQARPLGAYSSLSEVVGGADLLDLRQRFGTSTSSRLDNSTLQMIHLTRSTLLEYSGLTYYGSPPCKVRRSQKGIGFSAPHSGSTCISLSLIGRPAHSVFRLLRTLIFLDEYHFSMTSS